MHVITGSQSQVRTELFELGASLGLAAQAGAAVLETFLERRAPPTSSAHAAAGAGIGCADGTDITSGQRRVDSAAGRSDKGGRGRKGIGSQRSDADAEDDLVKQVFASLSMAKDVLAALRTRAPSLSIFANARA